MPVDIETMAATIGVVKGIPDTAAGRATIEADRAEQASLLAQQYGYRINVSGTTLMIGLEENE